MDRIILGQCLLGFLAVVAILVNLQLVRLGLWYRKRQRPLAGILVAMLFWLPLLATALTAGGIVLAESSLLGYHAPQDLSWLERFAFGVGLSIFADAFAALIWIPMREIFNARVATDDLVETFAMLAAQVRARDTEDEVRAGTTEEDEQKP